MIRKYIIVADDSIKGFDKEIAKLEREWGAEEIEPCNDCVNRQDVLAILFNAYNESRFDGYSDYCAVSDLVADLPSIKIGG